MPPLHVPRAPVQAPSAFQKFHDARLNRGCCSRASTTVATMMSQVVKDDDIAELPD
jgi:hypothetical protein